MMITAKADPIREMTMETSADRQAVVRWKTSRNPVAARGLDQFPLLARQ
jgi:hypothetical protein